MEKMTLIPYEKYQRLTSKSTSQQKAMDDVTEGEGFKTPIEKKRKLGPPGTPVKPYDRHPKTNTSVRAEKKPTWITVFVRFKKCVSLKNIAFVCMVYCVTSP